MRQTICVILAAGAGTRMKSDIPKVLFPLAGKPMLSYVIEAADYLKPERTICVIGHKMEKILEIIPDLDYAVQHEQKGTGHALLSAVKELEAFSGDVVVLCGDTPLIKPESLLEMLELHRNSDSAATVMTFNADNPHGYGRIIREEHGNVTAIVEESELNPQQKSVSEVNAGVYAFKAEDVLPLLTRLQSTNSKGEVFLTDVIELLHASALKVSAYIEKVPENTRGVNDRWSLSMAERELMNRRLKELALSGVSVLDPETVRLDMSVRAEKDSVIGPFAVLKGNCVVEKNAVVGPFVNLENVEVSAGINVSACSCQNVRLTRDVSSSLFNEHKGCSEDGN